jgi:phytoene synthase
MDPEIETIFKQNSTSYYYSSLLFPRDVREDVFKLYSYVRVLDEFVDDPPQQKEKLEKYRGLTMDNWESGETDEKIVNYFLEVARENNFEKEWAEAFLDSMKMDTYRNEYESMDETLKYIRGSAEVIGLMMTRILDLEEGAERPAELLGRSMQYCNFIRDVKEDRELGRRYLPREEMEKHGLDELSPEADVEAFQKFMHSQLEKYYNWQEKAEEGFVYIPYRVRVPVIISSRIYRYTADRIKEDPEVVWRKKVRSSKPRIAIEGVSSLKGKR